MGTKTVRNYYLHNLCKTMIGQLGITPGEFANLGTQGLYKRRADEVKILLRRMTFETLGRIAANGLSYEEGHQVGCTSLYNVHAGSYLKKYESGPGLLNEIAATTIIAEMSDILRPLAEKFVIEQGSQIQPEHF